MSSAGLLEVDHEPSCRNAHRCRAQARLVCLALEHRNLFQNYQDQMSDRGVGSDHSRLPGNCIALCCIVAWHVSWLTILTAASPAAVFTDIEPPTRTFDARWQARPPAKPRLLHHRRSTARRLSRPTSDAPPGTTVVWRGLSRLADLVEGARIAQDPSSSTYG